MKVILKIFLYLLSIVAGAVVLFFERKLQLGFFYTLLYYIGFYLAFKLIVFIISCILTFLGDYYDGDDRRRFSRIYFITYTVLLLLELYNSYNNILETIIIGFVGFMITNGIPCLIDLAPLMDGADIITPKASSNNYDIKSGYVTDKFGNIKAKSTTYIDGDIKKTYVTDNLGNTIAESTTIGNHTTTKIK